MNLSSYRTPAVKNGSVNRAVAAGWYIPPGGARSQFSPESVPWSHPILSNASRSQLRPDPSLLYWVLSCYSNYLSSGPQSDPFSRPPEAGGAVHTPPGATCSRSHVATSHGGSTDVRQALCYIAIRCSAQPGHQNRIDRQSAKTRGPFQKVRRSTSLVPQNRWLCSINGGKRAGRAELSENRR